MSFINFPVKKINFLRFQNRFTSTVGFFDRFSQNWWDIDGDMSILHDYNQVRIPFIANSYINRKKDKLETDFDPPDNSSNPFLFTQFGIFKEPYKRSSVHIESVLKGLKILDVGCGGGILTESLAKFGSKVLGIDPNENLIKVAKSHKKTHFDNYHLSLGLKNDYSNNLDYKSTSVYDFLTDKTRATFDIVVASEVIEHIDNREKEQFFETLTSFVKPGGLFVITTPGSSLSSYFVNVFLAENLFSKVPKHTHDFDLFISPRNCCRILKKLNFEPVSIQGLLYLPFLRRFFHINSPDLLYMYSFTTSDTE
ncbi:3-demethylubiquinone-9 3-O-methyltransferase [Theileria parva strain Muguga]|uniref:Ubiquinone biosynthesis O-methyltransferase, mitochondrial n=1 Tax=Theileria parva TaxID=5875 RepID=Q4N5U5_THEPA|nr:3-demethylubiquinone-9 3-O-methyltransferase [Theileria parva strain Muguga]EAN32478.1 3-demethylubiquinone-9 3-O-methyltransferase [Theileria parva strain Muguga]|eukprot:XP_764761.1 hexaprenyldihydroxybenzoate methyltransferase [Theileria parva strain Muguga]